MIGVVNKFFIASICMWAAPVAILYGFNHNLFPVLKAPAPCHLYHMIKVVKGLKKALSTFFWKRYGLRTRGRSPCDGFSQLSPESLTLWSGILAVISVNAVIAFYIYLAMQEPSDKHEPDPKFLADAKASIKQPGPSEADSASDHSKQE